MEIKNKLTVTRGEGGRGKTGERRGKDKSRNMQRGRMGVDNGREGLTVGVGVGRGRGEQWGKGKTTVSEQQ